MRDISKTLINFYYIWTLCRRKGNTAIKYYAHLKISQNLGWIYFIKLKDWACMWSWCLHVSFLIIRTSLWDQVATTNYNELHVQIRQHCPQLKGAYPIKYVFLSTATMWWRINYEYLHTRSIVYFSYFTISRAEFWMPTLPPGLLSVKLRPLQLYGTIFIRFSNQTCKTFFLECSELCSAKHLRQRNVMCGI